MGWLADLGVSLVYMCPVTVADDDPRQDMWSPRQVKSGFGNPRNPYRTGDYFHVRTKTLGRSSGLHIRRGSRFSSTWCFFTAVRPPKW